MTIIAAISDGQQVWMGSDSSAGNGAYMMTTSNPKIFTRLLFRDGLATFDKVVLGSSGDFRGDVLLRKMILPEYGSTTSLDEWVFELAEAMRAEFSKRGYACKENEQERQDLHVLVGIKGHIFSIWDSYEAVENGAGYMAIGSGMYFSLGAFHATDGLLAPGERLRAALEAAAAHNAYVRPPFHVETV